MGGKSIFTVEAVCEILDMNVPDDVLAEKYNTTVKAIRSKRYHLSNRNKITTSTEFKDFVAKSSHAARQYCQKDDNKIVSINKKTKTIPLLEIMDKIINDFAEFEVVCKDEKNKVRQEAVLQDEIAMLERLLDRNNVLMSRLIQQDLAFFIAVSNKTAKETQSEYLAKLGFSDSDIDFYRKHSLVFEEDKNGEV